MFKMMYKENLQIEVGEKKYSLKHEKKPLHDPNSIMMRN